MPEIATQTPSSSHFEETSCPLKYEEEVILRPKNYHAKCACCSENSNIETSNYEITFPDNMTFDEFELKLEEYAKIKSFPNINK